MNQANELFKEVARERLAKLLSKNLTKKRVKEIKSISKELEEVL